MSSAAAVHRLASDPNVMSAVNADIITASNDRASPSLSSMISVAHEMVAPKNILSEVKRQKDYENSSAHNSNTKHFQGKRDS